MIFALVIGGSGIAIYLIESPHEGAQITNLIDAFWWVSATVTTVGYGDVVPVTEIGRIMGIGLMFVGISIIGTIISSLGAILVGSRIKKHESVESSTKSLIIKKINDIEHLEKHEVELLISMVKDLHDEVKNNRKNMI
ncbi:two pore domain potassium channel family protein [Nitrosopumilus sp. K4]|uniref:potassium channel family protein n=1 Tax=Nitrosopumilus sp. K4 TaxID=2795383 RepID=UPI001BADC0B7|nr:potassium channel family protein [Nitrosopumilus sp. K4]QUC64232.1 two pore domain potassium channel family protein [Nitrosopumilus sp. K4]